MTHPPLFDHQVAALTWLNANPAHKFVALGVGLGKTRVGIEWAKTRTGKILVITTASKRDSLDWQAELASHKLAGEVISWAKLDQFVRTHDLASYLVIADEGRAAKSPNSNRGKAMTRLAKSCRDYIVLTATPADGYGDMINYAIMTGFVKNKTDYMRRFAVMNPFTPFPQVDRWINTNVIDDWWKSISFYHTPPVTRPAPVSRVIECKLDNDYYELIKTRIGVDGNELDTPASLYMALRQGSLTTAKLKMISRMLTEINEPFILFTNFKSEVDAIRERTDRPIYEISGSRHEIPEAATIEPNAVVVANIAAASEGLNLQFIRTAVFVSPSYSYASMAQAKGRVDRTGQTRTPYFYYLVATGKSSIEAKIYKVLAEKRDFTSKLSLDLDD